MAVLGCLLNLALLGSAVAIKSLKQCYDIEPDCIISPCALATCPNYPGSECRDWMCGSECKPEFWANNVEVTSQCQGAQDSTNNFLSTLLANTGTSNNVATGNPVINTGTLGAISPPTQGSGGGCPAGTPMTMCTGRPCDTTSCPAFPSATCTDNYCGGCKAVFRVGQQDVTAQCNSNAGTQMNSPQVNNVNFQIQVSGCPAHRQVFCRRDPCTFSTCQTFPGAMCRTSNCGGCFARFFFNGIEVTSRCRTWGNPQLLPLWYMGFPDMIGMA